ncbi:TMEM175 family protein [Kutzneria buriramensis]|uniref:Putative membrane protein n=1 Tax=Kutzneria buriramensis TaxID=1045776 RepID=A0A3E0H4J7_9PSEU|nr:TMEM175 family protein [Kutzneria buriramensis]REH38175.1 putative membrane protein [Kutzneria buriramensis]
MTEKSPERLVFFTDAVVAIALTLLVLPLTEVVPEVVAAHGDPIEVITGHLSQIGSFLLSFVVIGRQWIAHHRLFELVSGYNTALFLTNMVWLLSVVVMPFATQMVGGFATNEFTSLFYIGTILVNSGCLSVMTLLVRSDPALLREGANFTDRWLFNTIGTTVAVAGAAVLVLIVPSVNYYSLLLLMVPPVVARLVHPDAPKPTQLSE